MKNLIPCLAVAALLTGCAQSDGKSVDITGGPSSYARSVVYSCDDGTDFVADFAGDTATLSIASGPTVVLKQKQVASGISYSNGSYEFRRKGKSALLRQAGRRAANCAGLE